MRACLYVLRSKARAAGRAKESSESLALRSGWRRQLSGLLPPHVPLLAWASVSSGSCEKWSGESNIQEVPSRVWAALLHLAVLALCPLISLVPSPPRPTQTPSPSTTADDNASLGTGERREL